MLRSVLSLLARVGARLPVAINREWPLLKTGKKFLLARLRQDQITRDGHTLFLDPSDSLRLGMGETHEPKLVRFLQSTLRPGGRVIDAGAHIGYLTLAMAQAVGRTGKVYAFEPDPANFALLSRNIATNGYSNIVSVPAAVWSSKGRRPLFLRDDHHGDHRMYDPGGRRSAVTVDTVSLDDYFSDDQTIQLIKLDIQGSEMWALNGMTSLLRRSSQVVLVFEFWPRGLRGCGSDPEHLLTTLRELGFTICRLKESAELVAVTPGELLGELEPATKIGRICNTFRSRDYVDLIAVRSGLAESST